MTWTPIPIPERCDAWATAYGFMIDHIWAAPETNAARRPHWPEDMYVVVLPCTDLDPPTEESEGADHWVFFDDESEYGAPDDDRAAVDWLVGRVVNG